MNYKDSEKAEGAAEGPSDNRLHFPLPPVLSRAHASHLPSWGQGMATLVCCREYVILSFRVRSPPCSLIRLSGNGC